MVLRRNYERPPRNGRYITAFILESEEPKRSNTMTSKTLMATLRRDVSFVGNAIIAVVFVGFASLAIASALLDLISLRQ
jgi:hypothetical protein